MKYTGNIKADTVIRSVLLAVALLNQILAIAGKDTLPVYESDIVQIVSLLFTLGSTLWAWWKNNSFTKAAIEADAYLEELQEKEK